MDFQAFDLSYVCDKSNLEDNSKKHCLVFQPVYKQFKTFANGNLVTAQKSKGLSSGELPAAFKNSH